jgi:hypothetical protein
MNHITKTTYLQFLACGKNTWLQLYKPELQDMFELSDFEKGLLAKGNLVERWARKLFSDGILINVYGEEAAKMTQECITQHSPIIFQATFIHKTFMARNDVLEYDQANDCWNLHEIKGTNSLNEHEEKVDHIEDTTFQTIILEVCGIKIGSIKLIYLNKEYVRGDEINVQELFAREDITEQVNKRKERTREDMERAAKALFQVDEKALECQCVYLGRSAHCTTFKYSYPHIPDYSIHDLARIGNSKKKLVDLIDSQIYDINDIPDDFVLSDIQTNQVLVHKRQTPIINTESVRRELDALQFPLYFLDYETYPPAIPLFKGFKPYQQVPFQFSLDVLTDPDGELVHYEYLHEQASDPSEAIITKLQQVIGREGNIIVWNKSFERKINTQLAERSHEDQAFLEDINERVYDLMDIFQKQMYVHPGFKGKTSIKKVLPVLVPKLTYTDLEIREGGAATEAWYEMVFGDATTTLEKQKISEDLKKYCGRDTYAMYAIWRFLWKTVNNIVDTN